MSFSLGAFSFFSMGMPGKQASGPVLLAENSRVITRPNVDGAAIVRLGIQAGEAFQWETEGGYTTVAAALTDHGLMRAVIGNTLLQMIWRGVDMDGVNTRFLAQKISAPEILSPALLCYPASPTAAVWMRTVWTLQAHEI